MIENIKKWFNYDPFKWRVRVSAGVVIILKNEKVLLCHPTGHRWVNSYSFPKGHLDDGETQIQAALRELKEETSVVINEDLIENKDNPILVDYKNKSGFNYKKVYLFIVRINSVEEIGLTEETIEKSKLQVEEVDWCGFLSKDEAKKRIFGRFSHLLELIE